MQLVRPLGRSSQPAAHRGPHRACGPRGRSVWLWGGGVAPARTAPGPAQAAAGQGGDAAQPHAPLGAGRIRLYRQPRNQQQPDDATGGYQQQHAPADAAAAQQQQQQPDQTNVKEFLAAWDYRAAFGEEADAWDVLPPQQPRRAKGGEQAQGSQQDPQQQEEEKQGSTAAAPVAAAPWPDLYDAAGDEAIPPPHVWQQELQPFRAIMTDPARPWAQPLVLRLCYCRNDPTTQRAFRRLPPRAMQRLLAKRSSIERRAAASVHDLEALHQRLLVLHQGIFQEGCGITEDEANKEREWVALMRERLKAHTAALDTQRATAAARGDTHYVTSTDRLRSVLGRVGEVATDYLQAHLRVLIREGLANANAGAPWLAARRRQRNSSLGGGGRGDSGGDSDEDDSGSDEGEEEAEGEESGGSRSSRQGRKKPSPGRSGGAATAARRSQGGAAAAASARPRPPAPLTDLLADYRRAALAFECYRDPTLFTRAPGGGEPSSAGARFFAGAGAPDGSGESAGGPTAPQRIFGLRSPNRRQVMLGNASHFFREQRMPLLAPPPSRLAALVARLSAAGQLPGQTSETAGQTGAETAEDEVPSVAELAEVSLGGCDPPPLRVLQRRAAALEGELMYGSMRHILRDQRLAAEAAGEPDAAVPAARRAQQTPRAAAQRPLFGVDAGGSGGGSRGGEDGEMLL